MRISASDLDPEQTYKLMTGLIVPRPIAWITSVNAGGVVNLAPFSCFTFVSNKPPMVGINIGRKAGVRKDTASNIAARGEFVVNVADESLIEAVHLSAVEHPPEVSEPELLGLGLEASSQIAVPRLADAPASLECRLHSVIPFGETGAEFFVGEVVAFHVREGLMQGGKIDSGLLRPIARLAGPHYAGLGNIVRMQAIGQTPKTVLKDGQT